MVLMEREQRAQELAERAAREAAADEELLRSRPTLPKAPRRPDLRYIRDEAKRARKQAEYDAAMEIYTADKKEYKEVLLPAFRKAQMRRVSRADYEETRKYQLEVRAQEAVARKAAAEERREALESLKRRAELLDGKCGVVACQVCNEAYTGSGFHVLHFPVNDKRGILCVHKQEVLDQMGCTTEQAERILRAVLKFMPSKEEREVIDGAVREEVERLRRKPFPSLRLLALESIDAQRDKSSPTWLDLNWTEYKRKGESASTAFDGRFAWCAQYARGLPFTHPAWHHLHRYQGQYLRERGLLVDAEREFKEASDMLHPPRESLLDPLLALPTFGSPTTDTRVCSSLKEPRCYVDGVARVHAAQSTADQRLSRVRKLRRERRYGMDREGNRVWCSGSAMAKRCRMPDAVAPPDASDDAGPSSADVAAARGRSESA